jgi:hypothetical protein
MRLVEHVAWMGETTNAHNNVDRKSEGKDSIKLDIKERG